MFAYLRREIEEQDIFGIPVTLTIGGKNAFRTLCGGIVTILVILAVGIQSCFALNDVFYNP